jgi:hypothetical protein
VAVVEVPLTGKAENRKAERVEGGMLVAKHCGSVDAQPVLIAQQCKAPILLRPGSLG